jgi:hypothetical protein
MSVCAPQFAPASVTLPVASPGDAWYHPSMTRALKKLIDTLSRLPDREQEQIAIEILSDLATDERWEATLAASPGALERLADEAVAEYRSGRTKPLDADSF